MKPNETIVKKENNRKNGVVFSVANQVVLVAIAGHGFLVVIGADPGSPVDDELELGAVGRSRFVGGLGGRAIQSDLAGEHAVV